MGLEQAGYTPVFVNELHPDAMNTYLANRSSSLAEPENHAHDIFELTDSDGRLSDLASRLKRENGEIDLVAGGPPCQGYSGIGHRRSFNVSKEEIPSNHLYREMAKVITAVAPRAFLFENVRGLLTARWIPEGPKGEIWDDVQKTFKDIRVNVNGKSLSYKVRSHLVLAKDYGVPQNRPRVLLVGLRDDLSPKLDENLPAEGLLPAPAGVPPSPVDLLGDLLDPQWEPGGATVAYPQRAATSIQRILRSAKEGSSVAPKGGRLTEHSYSKHSARVTEKFEYMIANDGAIPEEMRTKKFAQRVLPRVWGPNGPTITATSLPDDYVHFSQPRVLTVREWARLQTFPDWYQFAGKRTTGGRRRAGDPSTGDWTREVPKYTQIGNAVPVKLAEAVGRHLLSLTE